MYCTYCGKQIPDNSSFCPSCGAKNEAEPATTSVRTESAPTPQETQWQQASRIEPRETQDASTNQTLKPDRTSRPVKNPKRHGCLMTTLAILALLGTIIGVLIYCGAWFYSEEGEEMMSLISGEASVETTAVEVDDLYEEYHILI